MQNCDSKLNLPVQYLKGVGPKMAERLRKLGIGTVTDLINYYPRAYADFTEITKIADLRNFNGQNITIEANIINIANRRTSRKKFTITEAVVADTTGSVKIVWFNQPFVLKMLKAGQSVNINGKVGHDRFSGVMQIESPVLVKDQKIVPIYSETVGITSNYISRLVLSVKDQIFEISEYLPEEIIQNNGLISIQKTLLNLHQPQNQLSLAEAKKRAAFDELFLFSLQKQITKIENENNYAPKMSINEVFLQKFVHTLPYNLTNAQKKSAWAIIKDMAKNRPMNRLLNGDVGSGKTVVAAFAAAVAVKNGFRVALLAPTEILANQHYQTLSQILKSHRISVGLVTSTTRKKESKNNHKQEDNILVGTHALLYLKNQIEDLGLVIIDEQHRFGVSQRGKLLEGRELKIEDKKNKPKTDDLKNSRILRPHLLTMTATPIPRTMSLVVFADLNVSVIDEMPKNRKNVITRIVEPNGRVDAYKFIRNEIKKNHQAFVVCPLIDENSDLSKSSNQLFDEDRKTVVKEAEKLQKEIFPDLRIGVLHGKLKSKDKEAIMADFKAKKYDILVTTSVVEVGVDIPNATVMMVENAERFGLAQLHQFRGRVGRSDIQSYCLLFSALSSEKSRERLSFMESTNSGFELAEKDLELRGPGEMYGYQQSGFWNFRFADFGDKILLERATDSAKSIAAEINKFPKLLGKLEKQQHLE